MLIVYVILDVVVVVVAVLFLGFLSCCGLCARVRFVWFLGSFHTDGK